MERLNTYLTEREVNGVTYGSINIEAKTEEEAILLLYIHGYENYKVIGQLIESIGEEID